jgi:hypothetical protein
MSLDVSKYARLTDLEHVNTLLKDDGIRKKLLEYNKKAFGKFMLFNAIVFSRNLELVKTLLEAGFDIPQKYLEYPLDIMCKEHSLFGFVPDPDIRKYLCDKFQHRDLAKTFKSDRFYYAAAYYNDKLHVYHNKKIIRNCDKVDMFLTTLPFRKDPEQTDKSLFATKLTCYPILCKLEYTVFLGKDELCFKWEGTDNFSLLVTNSLDKTLSIVKASELMAQHDVFSYFNLDKYEEVDDLWPGYHEELFAQFVYFREHTSEPREGAKRTKTKDGYVFMFDGKEHVDLTWEFTWDEEHESIVQVMESETLPREAHMRLGDWRDHGPGTEIDRKPWNDVMRQVIHNMVSYKIYNNMFKGRKPRVTKLQYDSLKCVNTRWTMLPTLQTSDGTGDRKPPLKAKLGVSWEDFNA